MESEPCPFSAICALILIYATTSALSLGSGVERSQEKEISYLRLLSVLFDDLLLPRCTNPLCLHLYLDSMLNEWAANMQAEMRLLSGQSKCFRDGRPGFDITLGRTGPQAQSWE